jgi:hypothetical protein
MFILIGMNAQVNQVQTGNRPIYFDSPLKHKEASMTKSINSCLNDTLDYALTKATGLEVLSINNASSGQAISQYFNAPQDITVHGVTFYAYKQDLIGGPTVNVTIELYLAGADSMPTGSALATENLIVDTTYGGGALSTLEKNVTFSNPITVNQAYVIVVANYSPNSIGIVNNSYSSADGAQEWLSSVDLFGTWTRSYNVVVGGSSLDADFLIAPHVSYDLTVDFSATPVNFSAPASVSFTNNSSPVLNDRMYNYAAYIGSDNLSFTYDFGDGSTPVNIINPTHNYTAAQPYTVTLKDTIYGWRTNCFGLETLELNTSLPDLVITEIMYNSAESGTDSSEFIEIYNNGSNAVNLNNFTCTGGVYTFPNVSLAAGDYYVITINASGFLNTYGFNADGVFTSGLSNAGEDIVLKNASGITIDSVDYDDGTPWPSGDASGQSDGGGASLVLCDVNSDNNVGSNWSACVTNTGVTVNNLQVFASPGAANVCCTIAQGTESSTICSNESVTVNGTVYDATNPTGTEVFTNGGANGCDSVVTINLTILPVLTGSETSTICSNESITVNGTVYDATNPTGTELFTNGGSNGCDSTVTINLTILSAPTGSETSTICINESITVNGTVYDAANPTGTEVFANAGANGCDSTVTVNLAILPAINVTTSQSDADLSANAAGLVYQWIDCNNGNTIISGETSQNYTATSSGSYAVVISENNCVDTSVCLTVNSVGFDDLSTLKGVKVYPNPSKGSFFIEFDEAVKNPQTISIYSSIGALVYSETLRDKITKVNTESFSSGLYLLELTDKETKQVTRLVIE